MLTESQLIESTAASMPAPDECTREYGQTVGDLLRLLKRAQRVQVVIARSQGPISIGSLFIAPSTLRNALLRETPDARFGSELVTESDGKTWLVIGHGTLSLATDRLRAA